MPPRDDCPFVDEENARPPAQRWHIDKGVPIVLLVGLAGQFLWFSYLVGQTSSQIGDHERRLSIVEAQRVGERLQVLEVQMTGLNVTAQRIDAKIDKVIDRQLNRPPGSEDRRSLN